MSAQPLWKPSKERIKNSNFQRYFSFLKEQYDLSLKSYDDLYQWSITEIPTFWESLWKFFSLKSSSYTKVMGERKMPGTKWFEGVTFNFAENLLCYRDDQEAIVAIGEKGVTHRISYKALYVRVAKIAKGLRDAGVKKGDRVAAFMPNIPEAIIGMLATNSIGAVWSSCSPDFGIPGVLDRFGQIKPKVLVTADGYFYNGKTFSSISRVAEIIKDLPSVEKIVVVPYIEKKPNISSLPNAVLANDFANNDAMEIEFEQLPFDHPLYIMYSSGTTGVPKCIVHGQGGTLLQHLKELVLHTDLKRDDRICYMTTCGWMMWNWLATSLAVGATVIVSEGSSGYPDLSIKWKMVAKEKISVFGISPKYMSLCEKGNVSLKDISDFPHLKTILSTGSPLSEQNFAWVYSNVKKDVQLSSICGGTDIISCFMLGNPLLPVYSEQIQCRGLGMKVEAWNEDDKPLIGQKGELVCTEPFPSMPIYFWNDPDEKKYKKAYFEKYPGIWHHGDYIEITEQGGVQVHGRSDATLNPGGIRIGTAEIYRQIELLPEIKDSIVIGQQWENDTRVVLFVVLAEGHSLTPELEKKIKVTIKQGASPRHVPAKILTVTGVPYTISGKKVEMAVTKIVHGEAVKNKDALMNPQVLDEYKDRRELQS